MPYQSFEDLEVWEKARALKIEIFEIVKSFPAAEKYSLTYQVIRSARSVAAQISEGHGRRTYPDRIRFCVIARGSLSETLNHLIDAHDCGYMTEDKLLYFHNLICEVEKLLNGYISFLEKKIQI